MYDSFMDGLFKVGGHVNRNSEAGRVRGRIVTRDVNRDRSISRYYPKSGRMLQLIIARPSMLCCHGFNLDQYPRPRQRGNHHEDRSRSRITEMARAHFAVRRQIIGAR